MKYSNMMTFFLLCSNIKSKCWYWIIRLSCPFWHLEKKTRIVWVIFLVVVYCKNAWNQMEIACNYTLIIVLLGSAARFILISVLNGSRGSEPAEKRSSEAEYKNEAVWFSGVWCKHVADLGCWTCKLHSVHH